MSSLRLLPERDPAATWRFDLPDWSQVEVTGTHAQRFLQSFCTNDIQKLNPGSTCEAFVCDVKGKILAHILVFALPQSWLLIGVPGTAAVLLPHLLKYRLDADVEFVDLTKERRLVCLRGAEMPKQLAQSWGMKECPGLRQCVERESATGTLLMAGTDMVPGLALLLSGALATVEGCLRAFPAEQIQQGTAAQWELLRIAAGFPIYGQDLNAQDLAQNAARTERAISFTKGCYLGQEPIARLDAMGHTNQELRGLRIQRAGIVVGAAVIADAKDVGKITSVAPMPGGQESLALAKIRTAVAAPGTLLSVGSAADAVSAQVFWPALDSSF